MSKKFKILSLLEQPRFWLIPIISITSIVPITLTQRQFSAQNSPSPEAEVLPSPDPAVSPISQWSEDLVQSESDPLKSTTDDLLEKPQPITAKPSPEETKPTATPSKEKKVAESAKTAQPSPSPKTASQAASNLNLPQRQNPPGPTPPLPPQQASQPRQPQRIETYVPPKLEIKVAIVRNESAINVGTSTAAYIFDANGKLLDNVQPNQGFIVQANGNSLSVDGKNLPPLFWVQPTNKGLVYVGDRWYRGRLLMVSQGNTLLAINYVDLEQYLYSVVGSEMHPTANMEALKAQAVAARSYALVHIIRPASKWYHLGSTTRWQAYNGINKEYNTSIQAVELTAGQILSYKGGVVESLYAATDDIVRRAHGGRGMSQTGAYELADSGYDYQRILANYYPGVQLARLELN